MIIEHAFSGIPNDLSPLFCGFQQCEKGHRFGPYVRNCFLIHFCLAGKGTLWDKRGEHKITAGDLFVIRPGEVTVYEADKTHPWQYGWIGFQGRAAHCFLQGPSVYPCPAALLPRIKELYASDCQFPLQFLSVLYELISRLFDVENETDAGGRIASVRRYVQYNYMQNIRVSDLAKTFHLERSYLFRLFKRRYGVSVKEFLTSVRMEQAKLLLKKGHGVSTAARMVGYEDSFLFSKTYKKHFGVPPREDASRS